MVITEFGSEFFLSNKLNEVDVQISVEDTSHLVYLRSGRDALRFVASEICKSTSNVLLPAYCCESMIKPFKDMGINVMFYKLNHKFLPDLDDVMSLIKDGDALLYIDYFGKKSFEVEELLTIRKKYSNIIFIEDRTQDIFNQKVYLEFKPDYIVASLRKWFALPDGGVAYSIGDGFKTKPINEISFFTTTRQEALQTKYQYLINGDLSLKNQYRSMFSEAEHYLGECNDIFSMSEDSRKLLGAFDFNLMKSRRLQNYNYLLNELSNNASVDIGFSYIQECPLYFPILIEDRDDVQRMLAQENIYCSVIWPIPNEATNVCTNSNYVSDCILAIPCDQRYTIKDMQYIVSKIRDIINNKNAGGNANE